jgi:hypothetical protein
VAVAAAVVAGIVGVIATIAVISGRSPVGQERVAPAEGVLIVDSVPWAEVESVVDEGGVSLALESPAYTPLRLTVPAGSYEIVLRREGETRRIEAQVGEAATVRSVARFEEVDLDRFLSGLGL